MNLGSPVNTPVGYGAPPSYSGFQSPVPGVQPQFHSTMVGGQSMTPLGQSPVVAGSQMQQGNPGTPGFLPGYLMGSFPQQVHIAQKSHRNQLLKMELMLKLLKCHPNRLALSLPSCFLVL